MNRKVVFTILAMLTTGGLVAQEISTLSTYVDSDLCARLLLGPITSERVQCSQSTYKEGSQAVLVWLKNNMVLTANKDKLIGPLVGQLAEVSGKLKAKDGTIKLESAKSITEASIPQGDPGRKMLDVRTYRTDKSAQLHEKIRHELAMMPYISVFDFISFTQSGSDVILTGWTVRAINRDDAARAVRNVEGVETVINNIDILPLGSFDMQIRAAARAALQRFLSRYFWGSGSDIKIVVKNGNIILLGTVATKEDSDIAFIQCNGVPGSFKVFNMLRVQNSGKKT